MLSEQHITTFYVIRLYDIIKLDMQQQFINKHFAYFKNLLQELLVRYFLDKTMYYASLHS